VDAQAEEMPDQPPRQAQSQLGEFGRIWGNLGGERLQLFVDALVATLQDLEASFLGISHRQRLGNFRRIDLADQLLHRFPAKRADFQRRSIDWPAQLKPA
jgi:hypothetical protein